MRNGWTGGQYSVFRFLLGNHVAIVFVGTIAGGAPWTLAAGFPYLAIAVLFLGATLAVFLALGFLDRTAAAVASVLIVGVLAIDARALPPLAPLLLLPLLNHCFLPASPYGSWSARGRTDPGGAWRWPPLLFLVTRLLILALFFYTGTAVAILTGRGAEPGGGAAFVWGLFYAVTPFLLIPSRFRLGVWIGLLVSHVAALLIFGHISGSWMLLTLMLFNPDWVRPKIGAGKATMFYDGDCALCHGSVRFVLAEDRFDSIRFAPLQGDAFRAKTTPTERERLGDSVVFETEEGELLSRSTAIAFMLERLGGLWRLAGVLLRLVPRPPRDIAYECVARTRYGIFGKKEEHCPVLPPDLRDRFDV